MRDRLTAQVLFSRSGQQCDRRDGHAAHLAWDRTAPRYGWSVSLPDIGSDFRADSGFVPQTGVDALALNTRTTWSFNRKSFLRLFGDWQRVEWDTALAPTRRRREGFFTGTLLYGYRLNWQTSLYAGYGDACRIDAAGALVDPEKQVFVKLSYAIRKEGH